MKSRYEQLTDHIKVELYMQYFKIQKKKYFDKLDIDVV